MNPLLNATSFLDGPYTPVTDERTDHCRISGELPDAMRGMFVQNSPNPKLPPIGAYHWFDGDGMVHGVEIQDGKATYRNRWTRTPDLAEEEAAGLALYPGILNPITRRDKDTANTDLCFHNGKLLALWWLGGQPMQLDVPSLETVGAEDFNGTLTCGVAAHPKVDPRTGELLFFDYDPYEAPHMRYGVASPDGRVTNCVDIELGGPSLLHDIAFTPEHTVLLDFPMRWDVERLARGRRRVQFDTEAPARIGLIPRHGSEVRWFEGPACYSYHTVNAWEEGDETVLIACRIDNPMPSVPHDQEPDIPRLTFLRIHPFLHEWRLNRATGQMTERVLDDVPTEFPRINDRFLGVKSRYAYHPRVARARNLVFDALLKYDLEAGANITHEWGPDTIAGEAVFVSDPGRSGEDDGWLCAYATDLRQGETTLRVLDASDLSEVARVHIPRRMPIGFHADWAPIGAPA
ncbi:MAG: 9-cis-epoxycarotenoid dioxygenase [Proteobacteria bacterium]|nr:9-cis-epoxycarotenoid dioxygenase [Pseudomonadota bacterium]MCP4918310.1 9-cis-epoxycarotenoid dioxygenase [Pseudomonadota bacterium]